MRTDVQWTLATLSSRAGKVAAGKAAKAAPPRLALDGKISALHRRKQLCSLRGRRGVGVRGDRHRASPIRAV
jgi:hypothetical protein